MSSRDDPLLLSGLEPANIQAQVESRKVKPAKPPNELDIQKEERLKMKEARLNSKLSAGNVKPTQPVNIEEEPLIEKDPQLLLDKVNALKERFPYLRSRNKLSGKSSVAEIEDELHYYEVQLGSNNGKGFAMEFFLVGLKGFEMSTTFYNPLNLHLNGLAQIARDNTDKFQDVIDELAIKYGATFHLPPEYRLALAVGSLVYTVHSANCGDTRMSEMMQKMNEAMNAKKKGAEDL